MRINGWQRIGIVASFAWILGAGFQTLKAIDDRAINMSVFMHEQCDKSRDELQDQQNEIQQDEKSKQNQEFEEWLKRHKSQEWLNQRQNLLEQRRQREQEQAQQEWQECDKDADEALTNLSKGAWDEAALAAFVPVPFGWGAAYVLLFVVRWVRRGSFKSGAGKPSV
jgi:hypothetical protein